MNQHKPKTIYFTFDDGPSKTTPRLLEILRENKIKATFFVSAKYGCNQMLKDIHKEGHLVCLHSYSHDYNDIYKDEEAFFNDLHKLEELIKQQCGQVNHIYRFPGGSCNSIDHNFIDKLAKTLENKGYLIFDWDSDNRDGIVEQKPSALYLSTALTQIAKHDKTIFLLHNRPQDGNSIESLPMIINFCKQNGYRIALINELTGSEYALKKRKTK